MVFRNRDINPCINGIGHGSDPNVISKTTVEMLRVNTFLEADWDFVENWQTGLGQYPSLRTFKAPDMNFDKIINLVDLSIFCRFWLEEY